MVVQNLSVWPWIRSPLMLSEPNALARERGAVLPVTC